MRCYAERQAYRAAAMGIERYIGLTKKVGDEIRWTGEVRVVEEALALPLKWRRPRRIFVNSMSDLFHEKVADEQLADVFLMMALARQHTYQVLTKRPDRMRAWCSDAEARINVVKAKRADWIATNALNSFPWPLPNVWLGVSVEDQATADERIPLLLQTPAAVRWVSYEPALGPVDFRRIPHPLRAPGVDFAWLDTFNLVNGVRWIVVGGESGPGARPFDLSWARQTIAQCRAGWASVFVKQLGARPWQGAFTDLGGSRLVTLRDRKGADMAEWPEDLKIREFPA
jgi:protein gp37